MQRQEEALTKVDSGVCARWQREETVALLKVKSEMEAAFPSQPRALLWEQISRKLGELGYNRSAHKCKEKFGNTQKYYKRIKDGHAFCQNVKTYKFSAEFEALHDNTIVTGGSINPLQVIPTTPDAAPISMFPSMSQCQAMVLSQTAPLVVSLAPSIGINFLSDSSASSEEDDDDNKKMETETVDTLSYSRKRKRAHDSDQGMTDFVDGLMKQVMQKQEAMQQKFLETIVKREQDRMVREEAWKMQELARLERQRELAAQERIVSASRNTAIVDLLQKITGQSIQFPAAVHPNNHLAHQHIQNQQEMTCSSHKQSQEIEIIRARQPHNTSEVVSIVPEEQIVPNQDLSDDCSLEGTFSRWLEPGILALIQLSGMESKFQEKGDSEDSVRKRLQLSHGTTCNLGSNVDDRESCDLNREDDEFNYEETKSMVILKKLN